LCGWFTSICRARRRRERAGSCAKPSAGERKTSRGTEGKNAMKRVGSRVSRVSRTRPFTKRFEAFGEGSTARPVARPISRPKTTMRELELGRPMSITEVAKLIGCSPWTVRQRFLPKGLPHFRAGASGKLIFYRDQVLRWIESQTKGGKTK